MLMQRSRHQFDRFVSCKCAPFRCACTRTKLQATGTSRPGRWRHLRRRLLSFHLILAAPTAQASRQPQATRATSAASAHSNCRNLLRARVTAGAHGCRRRYRSNWIMLPSGFLGEGGGACFAHGCMLPTACACIQQVWVGLLADCLWIHPLVSAVA